MTITPADYERLYAEITREVTRDKNIAVIGEIKHGYTNRIMGISGYEHQIDVSVEYQDRDKVKRLKLVECKLFAKDKIGIGDVLVFHARIKDIQLLRGDDIIVEGNLVTTVGYTKHAVEYSRYYHIVGNSAQLDSDKEKIIAWSISFKDETIVPAKTAVIQSSAGNIKISP
jgi:hypothetical protein